MDPLSRSPRHAAVAPANLPAHRLARWQRLALFASGFVLLLTGLLWLVVHYAFGAGAGELPHPLEAWSLRLHGLAGFAALFVLGVLAAAHIPQGWRLSHRRRWRWQRRSGVILCVCAVGLVFTAYLLYYFASESARPAIGWAHTGIGVIMATLVVAHRRGTRAESADAAAAADPAGGPPRA